MINREKGILFQFFSKQVLGTMYATFTKERQEFFEYRPKFTADIIDVHIFADFFEGHCLAFGSWLPKGRIRIRFNVQAKPKSNHLILLSIYFFFNHFQNFSSFHDLILFRFCLKNICEVLFKTTHLILEAVSLFLVWDVYHLAFDLNFVHFVLNMVVRIGEKASLSFILNIIPLYGFEKSYISSLDKIIEFRYSFISKVQFSG